MWNPQFPSLPKQRFLSLDTTPEEWRGVVVKMGSATVLGQAGRGTKLPPMINARTEAVASKPLYRAAFKCPAAVLSPPLATTNDSNLHSPSFLVPALIALKATLPIQLDRQPLFLTAVSPPPSSALLVLFFHRRRVSQVQPRLR